MGAFATGGALVEQTMQGDDPIDVLRPYAISAALGVQSDTDFVGNPVYPRITSSSTSGEAVEAAALTESEGTLDNVTASPHVVGALNRASRLFRQSGPGEQIVRTDILRSLAMEVDKLVFTASGSGGKPIGLLNASGMNAVSGTTANFATLTSAQLAALNANGLVDRRFAGWAAPPSVANLLAQRYEVTSNVARLWQGSLHTGTILNDRALSSS